MKNLFILLIFCGFLFSCGSESDKKKTSGYSDFEVEIDTVMVNSGSEILMAGSDNHLPAVSKDEKNFFGWDRKNYALEIVDLDEYKIKKKIYFEKDGPKGLQSEHFFNLFPLPNDYFGFEDFESYKIHDLKGNLIKKVNFDQDWITSDLDENESFELFSVNERGTVLAGMHFGFDNYKPLMFLLDSDNEKLESIVLPEFEKLKKYKIVLRRNGGYLTHVDPEIFIKFQGDSLLISNSAFNDIYIYNNKTKELKYKTFDHNSIPEGKQKTYKNESESEEEIVKILYEITEEVSFSKFFWDDKNSYYYRFSKIATYPEDQEPTWKVSMMIYDQNLNLIGEKDLMTFDTYASPLFVKDGKVHFHLNMEDELGFIRIGLKN
jgi:hypothetical protein